MNNQNKKKIVNGDITEIISISLQTGTLTVNLKTIQKQIALTKEKGNCFQNIQTGEKYIGLYLNGATEKNSLSLIPGTKFVDMTSIKTYKKI